MFSPWVIQPHQTNASDSSLLNVQVGVPSVWFISIFYSLAYTDNTLMELLFHLHALYCKTLKNKNKGARSEYKTDSFLTTAVSMALELPVDNLTKHCLWLGKYKEVASPSSKNHQGSREIHKRLWYQ